MKRKERRKGKRKGKEKREKNNKEVSRSTEGQKPRLIGQVFRTYRNKTPHKLKCSTRL